MKHRVAPLLLALVGCLLLGWSCWQISAVPAVVEYTAILPTTENSENGKTILSAISSVESNLSKQVSGYAVASGITLEGSLNRSATVTVYAVGPSWFDIFHRTLRDGRLLGNEELTEKTPVLVADSQLIFALFGENSFQEETVSVNGTSFRMVGVVDHSAQPGQTDDYAVYVPFLAAEKAGITFQTAVLCSEAAYLSDALFFQNACATLWQASGTMFYLSKEKLGQTMPVRYLLVLAAIYLLVCCFGLFRKWLTLLVHKLKERNRHVYAVSMILPCIGFALIAILLAGIWLAGCYVVTNTAVEPVYTFTEWVPENPASLTSIISVFKTQTSGYNALLSLSTPNVGFLRYYGSLISTGTVMCLLAAVWLFAGAKKQH